ncbi:phosphoribosyltransferase [Rhodovarius crocodyli]|uniref:Orotate phosphoribosyltransferase n=1 Tax=Rhodovarius crocodyli TaxID=1979269 RepID=A0A437MPK7_9PROT|nr:phosphoribosyltransferase [Rhodovarius crocodyli]RVT99568.1 phosphoribosyltransferase [Rhodovarius crocodyli]
MSPSVSGSAARVAQVLARIGAVRVTTGQPFVYTSGWASPVYVDTRLLMSEVALREELMELAAEHLRPIIAARGINAIVGAESTGIAFAAWIAARLSLPMLYLRKKALGWGSAARLEGRLPDAPRLLFVDDVTTDARSKLAAVQALRETGASAEDVLVLMDYAIYPRIPAMQAQGALTVHALTTWREVFAALEGLPPEAQAVLQAYTADPVAWSVEHGGVGA